MRSNIRYVMEKGHPTLLSEAAIDTIEKFVEVDLDSDLRQFKWTKESADFEARLCQNQMYWIGWMYSYIHYEKDILSRDLVELLPIEIMLNLYYCGHQVSDETFMRKIEDVNWPKI